MKLENGWQYKSLENLEKKSWGNVDYDSYLVKRCTQLSKIPVGDFSIEDLRIMIGQGFGLNYLVPLAIDQLKINILAEGDYYPGDLLKNVLTIPQDFWLSNEPLLIQLKQAISGNEVDIEDAGIRLKNFKIIN